MLEGLNTEGKYTHIAAADLYKITFSSHYFEAQCYFQELDRD